MRHQWHPLNNLKFYTYLYTLYVQWNNSCGYYMCYKFTDVLMKPWTDASITILWYLKFISYVLRNTTHLQYADKSANYTRLCKESSCIVRTKWKALIYFAGRTGFYCFSNVIWSVNLWNYYSFPMQSAVTSGWKNAFIRVKQTPFIPSHSPLTKCW
jgi:hypothetical protein